MTTNRAHSLSTLIADGIAYSAGRHKSRGLLLVTAQRLADLSASDHSDAHAAIAVRLDRAVDLVFEHGWQPAELVHAGQRAVDQPGQRLLLAAISGHAHRWSASTVAPHAWATQLSEIGVDVEASGDHLRRWETTERCNPVGRWVALLSTLGFLSRLPPLAPLLCVPSAWSATPHRDVATARPGVDKVLARIRGLLAKAESTSFADEAEALAAKAQDLMTRHAIDTAMVESAAVGDAPSPVATRRVLVDNPYFDTKASLLHAVARSNDVRAVSLDQFGIVTVIGMPVDLDFCELLFTSLLVQASRALTQSGAHASARTASYRRSFLYAFADGIGARLAKAREDAVREATTRYGSALVPVMDARAEAVDAAFREQFPKTTTSNRTVSNRAGWIAGRVAADHADLSVSGGQIVH